MNINTDEVMNSFRNILNQAQKGQDVAKNVATNLRLKAVELRKLSDQLVQLARYLDGNGAQESISKNVVILKDEKEAKRYIQSKKNPSKVNKSSKRCIKKDISSMTENEKKKYLMRVAQCKAMREKRIAKENPNSLYNTAKISHA